MNLVRILINYDMSGSLPIHFIIYRSGNNCFFNLCPSMNLRPSFFPGAAAQNILAGQKNMALTFRANTSLLVTRTHTALSIWLSISGMDFRYISLEVHVLSFPLSGSATVPIDLSQIFLPATSRNLSSFDGEIPLLVYSIVINHFQSLFFFLSG